MAGVSGSGYKWQSGRQKVSHRHKGESGWGQAASPLPSTAFPSVAAVGGRDNEFKMSFQYLENYKSNYWGGSS